MERGRGGTAAGCVSVGMVTSLCGGQLDEGGEDKGG